MVHVNVSFYASLLLVSPVYPFRVCSARGQSNASSHGVSSGQCLAVPTPHNNGHRGVSRDVALVFVDWRSFIGIP